MKKLYKISSSEIADEYNKIDWINNKKSRFDLILYMYLLLWIDCNKWVHEYSIIDLIQLNFFTMKSHAFFLSNA